MSVEIEGRRVMPPGRQGRMLLAYLVANRSRPVRRDELVEVIWEGTRPTSPDALLRTLLSRTRAALGGDRLVSRPHVSLRLPEDSWIDLEVIDAQAAQALETLGRGDPEALRFARDTLALMDAELLPGLEGSWIDERRRYLDDLRVSMLEVSVEAGLLVGGVELRSAERTARLLVDQAPYRESGYGILMRIHAARGDSAEAVRVYDRLRVLLREELGTTPGSEVTALNDRLLRQEEIAPAAGPVAPRVEDARPHSSPEATPLPPLLTSTREARFVGREEDRGRLWTRWKRTSFRPRLVAVTGEPGIGKTRLAGCFAHQVHEAGGTVLYGRCDEDPLTSFQPFVEALDHYLRHADVPRLVADLPGESSELRRLPSLRGPLGAGQDGVPAGEGDRYALFEAIVAVLRRAARTRPLLVVLDDLHWVDRPTFQLLLHLVRALDPLRCMFIATFRDVDAAPASTPDAERPAEALEGRLASLRREAEVERICLDGLGERETAELILARGGGARGEPFARRLKDLTGGNPFFVEEAVRSLSEQSGHPGDEAPELDRLGVPEGIREAVTRRLDRLGPESSEALAAASVIGPELELGVLEAVVDHPLRSVLDAVEELVGAGLLLEVPTKPDHFSFSHALVRETQYQRLLLSRRVRLHERIGLELERRADEDHRRAAPAELARHFFEARERVGPERAAHHSIEAASRAAQSLAHEDAAAHCARAIEVLGGVEDPDERRLCDLRLARGKALLRAARVGDAREVFRTAADSARRREAVDQLARAALGFHGRYTAAGEVHGERIELLEEARTVVGPADSGLHARVLARLAESLLWVARDRALDLSGEAVAMARRLGDRRAILEGLGGRHACLLHAEHLDERLEVSRERLRIAGDDGHRESTAAALRWYIYDLTEHGEMRAAKEQHARLAEVAGELRQPLYMSHARDWASVFAQLHGRYAEAERLGEEAFELSEGIQAESAEMQRLDKRFAIYREQGRLQELRPAVERFAIGAPCVVAWSALLALLEAEAGEAARARSQVDRLVARSAAAVPRDIFWLITVAALAETCAILDDAAEPGAAVYRLLLPHVDRCVQAGCADACWGSVSRFLALAATACEDWGAADGHFLTAARHNGQIGSAPLVARTRVDHAGMLLRQGDPTRHGEIEDLLTEASAVAEPMGMVDVCRRAQRLRAQATGGAVLA